MFDVILHTKQNKMLTFYISANHDMFKLTSTRQLYKSAVVSGGGGHDCGVKSQRDEKPLFEAVFKHLQAWNHWVFLKRTHQDFFQLCQWQKRQDIFDETTLTNCFLCLNLTMSTELSQCTSSWNKNVVSSVFDHKRKKNVTIYFSF